MFKSVFGILIFNLFLFFGVIQENEVSVHQNTPQTLAPGESYEVTVNILKPNVNGFAKLELIVDDGLEVKAGDMGSASFTFENGKAKFIWFTLPEENSFQIKYTLTNKETEIGSVKNITGHFSYLVDNQKQVFYLEDSIITIESIPNDSLVAIDEVIIPELTDDVPMLSEEERLQAIQDHVVKIQRSFERLESGEYLMNVAIDKGPIEGFAKLEDVVPGGFDYIENSTSGAIFTNIKGKAKFVWFNLPDEKIVNVSYKLKANESNVVGIHNITGIFTYLIDSRDIKSNTIPAFFKISPDDMVEVIETDNFGFADLKDQEQKETGVWTQEHVNFLDKEEENKSNIEEADKDTLQNLNSDISSEEIIAQNKDKTDSELTQDITSIDPVSEGINYRVQICATRKMAERDYFRKYKKFNYDITIDHHENWIKYTTGSYPEYKAARASRVLINKNYDFDGPFVTAYNNGERITVQEALMISNQQWYK